MIFKIIELEFDDFGDASVRKLLFIMPELGAGGAERVIFNIIKSLPAAKFDVELVLFKGQGYLASQLPPHVRVHTFGKKSLMRSFPILWKTFNGQYDLLCSSGYQNLLVALFGYLRGQSGKIVLRETSVIGSKRKSFLQRVIQKMLIPTLYPSCRNIIFQSHFGKNDFESTFGCKLRNSSILWNPAEPYESNLDGGTKSIFIVGSLTETKNQAAALNYLAGIDLRGYQVEIFGEGPERSHLKNLVDSKGLQDKVIFHGHVQSMKVHWHRARLHLLTSFHESLPNSVIEAAVYGVPTVCLEAPGGLKELLNVLPYGECTNPAEISNRILFYLENDSKEKRELLRKQAQSVFVEEAIKKYEAFFE